MCTFNILGFNLLNSFIFFLLTPPLHPSSSSSSSFSLLPAGSGQAALAPVGRAARRQRQRAPVTSGRGAAPTAPTAPTDPLRHRGRRRHHPEEHQPEVPVVVASSRPAASVVAWRDLAWCVETAPPVTRVPEDCRRRVRPGLGEDHWTGQ